MKCVSLISFGIAAMAVLQAQNYSTVTTFTDATAGPTSLIQGSDGNFYGTTGSEASTKAVFKMTPAGVLTTLYTAPKFGGGSLLQGSDGNFYGASDFDGAGVGTIFKMTPAGVLTPLYTFQETDGANPSAGLIQAMDGNFYGTTGQGGSTLTKGSSGAGTVFKLTPAGSLSTLHNFTGPDGLGPNGLIQAADGNFYGTTPYGGANNCASGQTLYAGCGTVFKITPTGTLTTLHSFAGPEGALPFGGLIQATDGNLYGTTGYGGPEPCETSGYSGCGTIFKITPAGSLTTLYTFGITDGAQPQNSLIQATDGNFYGTTQFGGTGTCQFPNRPNGCGTAFKLTPQGMLTTLYNVPPQVGSSFDTGQVPGVLLQASDANIYGLTKVGGSNGDGTVFQLSLGLPPVLPIIKTSGGVLNGASFAPGFAPDAWITINGTNLSLKTDTWSSAIVNGVLPTSLDGVRVLVGSLPAYIEYVSPTQINAVAPNVNPGTLTVTVSNANGISPAVQVQVQALQPAF